MFIRAALVHSMTLHEKGADRSRRLQPFCQGRQFLSGVLFSPLQNVGGEPEQADTDHKDRQHYQPSRNGLGVWPSKLDIHKEGAGQG